jgi:hypothetical protein
MGFGYHGFSAFIIDPVEAIAEDPRSLEHGGPLPSCFAVDRSPLQLTAELYRVVFCPFAGFSVAFGEAFAGGRWAVLFLLLLCLASSTSCSEFHLVSK